MKPRHEYDRNLNNDQFLKSCKSIGIKIFAGQASDITKADEKKISLYISCVMKFYIAEINNRSDK